MKHNFIARSVIYRLNCSDSYIGGFDPALTFSFCDYVSHLNSSLKREASNPEFHLKKFC